MPDIRKEQSYDGRWTVFIGTQIVISDLSGTQVEALISAYQRIAFGNDKAV